MIYSAFVNSLAIFLLVLLVFLLLHNLYQAYEHFRTARAFQRHSPHALFIPLSVLRKQPLRRAGLPQYLTNTVLQTHEQATASTTRTMNEAWHKRRKDKKGGRKMNTIVRRDSDHSVSKGQRGQVVRGSASSLSSAAALVDATHSQYSTTNTFDQAARSQSEEQGRSVKPSSYASATQRLHQQGSVNTVPLVASRDKTVVRADTSLLDTSRTGESSSNITVPLSSSLTQSAHSMSSGEYYANRSRQRRRSHTKRQAQYGASQEGNVRQGSYRPTTTNAVGGMYDMSMPFLSRAGVNLYENLEYDDYIHIDIWNGALDTAHVLERLQHNLERTADSSQTRVIGIRLPAQALPKPTPALHLQQCGQAQGSSCSESCALMLSSQLQCTTTTDDTNSVATRHAEGDEGRHGVSHPVRVSATYIVGADNDALLRHLAAGIWRTTTTIGTPSSYTAAGKEERMRATLVRLLCHFTQNEELVSLRASKHATQSAPPNENIATPSHSNNNNSGPHASMMPLRHATMNRFNEHAHHDNSDSYVFSSPGSSMTSSYGWRRQQHQVHGTQMNNGALMTRMEEGHGDGRALWGAATHNREHSAEGVAYNAGSVAHAMSREEQEHAADNSMAHNDAGKDKDSKGLRRATLCLAQSETPQYDLELTEPMPRTLVKTRRQGKKGSARYGKGYAEAYCDVSTTASLSPKARRETKKTKIKEGKAAVVRQYMQAQVESDVQEMELLPMWRRSALLTSLRSGRLSLGDLVLSVLRDRLEAYHDIFSHYSDDDEEDDEEEYLSNSENDDVGRHAHRFHTGSDDDDDIRPVGHSHSSEEDVHDEREAMRHSYYHHHNGYRSRMSHETNSYTPRQRSTVNAPCAYASWQDTVAAAAAVVAQMQIHKCRESRAEELRGLQMVDSALRRNGGGYDVLQDYVIAFTLCSTLQPFTHKPQYGDTSVLSRFTSDVAHTSFCSSSNHSDRYNYIRQQNDNVDAEMSRAMSWAGIVPGANVELLYGATVHDLATTLLAHQRSNTSRGLRQAHRSSLPGLMHRATFSYVGTDTTTMNHSTTSRDTSTVLRSRRNTAHYRHLSSSFSSCPRRVDSMDNLGTLEQHSTMTSHTESVSSTFRPLIERTATGPGLITDILSQPDERLLRSAATLSPSATNARGSPASPASSLSSDSYPATVVATEAHTRLTGPTTTITNSAGHHRAVNVNNTQPVEPTSNNTSETNLGSMSMTMLSSVIAAAGASASASPTQFAPLNMDHCMSPNTREAEASGHVMQQQLSAKESHTTQEGERIVQHEAASAVAVGNNTSSHKLSSTLAHPATQAVLTATAEGEGAVKEAEHSHTMYVADAHTNPATQSESEHEEDAASDILDALRDGAQLEGGLALPTPLRYLRLGTALYVVHEVIDKTFLQYRERRTMPTPLSSRATSCYGDEKGAAAIRKDNDETCSNASMTSTRSNTGGLTRRHDRKSAAALKRAERERRWAATRRFAEVGYSLSAGLETTNAYGQINISSTPCAGGSGWVREEVRMCWRCLSVEATVINLPCGHFATCAQCAALSTTCCVCNTTIDSTITLY